ncbi:hypothetical protein Z043_103218 [Scleropages formosus]|uniref:Uncharacterized protein n=1 Tax=Scleropages formosus TaxID=113540 RepID=A0A0P7VTG7_SCLFO|nr:hypothetical protein Z043_103218 [Scleropages formosus]
MLEDDIVYYNAKDNFTFVTLINASTEGLAGLSGNLDANETEGRKNRIRPEFKEDPSFRRLISYNHTAVHIPTDIYEGCKYNRMDISIYPAVTAGGSSPDVTNSGRLGCRALPRRASRTRHAKFSAALPALGQQGHRLYHLGHLLLPALPLALPGCFRATLGGATVFQSEPQVDRVGRSPFTVHRVPAALTSGPLAEQSALHLDSAPLRHGYLAPLPD